MSLPPLQSDAWAVGNVVQGVGYRLLTEHRDGAGWQLVPNRSGQRNATLLSVSEISPTAVQAVGSFVAPNGPSRPDGHGGVESGTDGRRALGTDAR